MTNPLSGRKDYHTKEYQRSQYLKHREHRLAYNKTRGQNIRDAVVAEKKAAGTYRPPGVHIDNTMDVKAMEWLVANGFRKPEETGCQPMPTMRWIPAQAFQLER